ncbi:hypothetical protein [Clostridium perfringens]|uniref:hypothetical protein n=1 Tax=Clostridium perfringens TaxID=1502 RepID=UPI0024BC420A|nr:hypothetical protein [Clostridium perfringens]
MSDLKTINTFINDIKEGNYKSKEEVKHKIEDILNEFKNQYNRLGDLIAITPKLMEAYKLVC